MKRSKEFIEEVIGAKDIINIQEEQYNKGYEGFTFHMRGLAYRSRLAKKTSKKVGYFVVFWEKDENHKNIPYTYEDGIDKVIVNILDGNNKGQFIFPKEELRDRGVLKSNTSKGKMAIRVYPSWETQLNATAKKVQQWQVPYFIDLSKGLDIQRVLYLYFGNLSLSKSEFVID